MPRRFDLTSAKENIQRRNSQRDTYGNQTPLSSTAVERGSTRWLSGSNVQINGILAVAGTFNVSGISTFSGALTIAGPTGITGSLTIQGVTDITGQLNVSGPTALDGVTTVNGDTTVTGKFDVTGPTTISGTLDITGDTTVDGNFEILGTGLFKAGETTIEPTGKATFGDVTIDPASIYLMQTPGGWISGTGADDITLASTLSGSVSMNNLRTELDFMGQKITLTLADTIISNRLTVQGAAEIMSNLVVRGSNVTLTSLPTTTSPANLHITAAGRVYRSTA